MADSKISALPAATAAAGTNELVINEAGVSKKLTVAQVKAFSEGVTIEEVDGTPTVTATKLVLPNGTLGVVGTVATYTPAAGGGVDWEQVINEDGTSFANFTAGTGTWSSNGTEIIQTDAGGAWRRAQYTTLLPIAFPLILEADLFIITANGRIAIGITPAAMTGGGPAVELINGTNVIRTDIDNVGTIRDIAQVIALDTWYKLRIVLGNIFMSIYLDGTLMGNIPLGRNSAWNVGTEYLMILSYGASVKFRNVKAWTLTTGAPA